MRRKGFSFPYPYDFPILSLQVLDWLEEVQQEWFTNDTMF
jgi:hypothetical protein